MTPTEQCMLTATLAFAIALPAPKAMGRTAAPSPSGQQSTQVQASTAAPAFSRSENQPQGNERENLDQSLLVAMPEISYASPRLLNFVDSGIKFKLETLMDVLRDSRHESWVLAAYPDPKTSRPLIGAGFSLDVKATDHLQSDPLNPHTFIEPSSAQLWRAAGLDPEKLQLILDQFEFDLKRWKKKNFRRKIKTRQLAPEVTDEEATRLLQISVVLAVHNARAYCREFEQLTWSQQMGLSQLVFQMGVNLEEFTQFLSTINDMDYRDSTQLGGTLESEADHWKAVQRTLIQSDWARRYTARAVTVIAMFDPNYDEDPRKAEREVRAEIPPLVVHHRKKPHARSDRAASDGPSQILVGSNTPVGLERLPSPHMQESVLYFGRTARCSISFAK